MSISGDSLINVGDIAVVVLIALFMFRQPLAEKIKNSASIAGKIDKGGVSFEMVASSTANLSAAIAGQTNSASPVTPSDIASSSEAASRAVQHVATLSQARVLWVDDNPDNNRFERRALSDLGIRFDLAESTSQAMVLLARNRYNLVISDFTRRDDPKGGFTLLGRLRDTKNATPLIIYSSSSSPEFIQEAKDHGAYDETNDPLRLYDLVVRAIVSEKPAV